MTPLCSPSLTRTKTPRRRRGNVMVLLAVLLPVLLILAGYLINVAYIEGINCEVQLVTDVAAQTAAREYVRTGDRDAALAIARESAARNPINGLIIPISMGDLEFGISNRASLATGYSFAPVIGSRPGNSVRITTTTLRNQEPPLFTTVFPSFSIAPPIRPVGIAACTQSTMDIALVIDRSGSMAFASNEMALPTSTPATQPAGWVWGDPVPANSRWLDTVATVRLFIDYLYASHQQEFLSLSTYSNSARTDALLSSRYSAVNNAMDAISVSFDGGGTAIGLGLMEGHAALTDPTRSRPFTSKVMILLTDGIQNYDISPESVLWKLRQDGITLFTVTFSDEADQARTANLAAECGGQHFHAVNASQLRMAFNDIARRLPSLMTQ